MNIIMPHAIDYEMLGQASQYYRNYHFQLIEVPYAVPIAYNNITKPLAIHEEHSFLLDKGMFKETPLELVGSAEQGFLYYADHHRLIPEQTYYAITPCFRFEECYDSIHMPWFMKLELYVESEDSMHVMAFVNMAKTFMQRYTTHTIDIEETGEHSFDLTINGIEVGSYGQRTYNHRTYAYGTGLALPRFSIARL